MNIIQKGNKKAKNVIKISIQFLGKKIFYFSGKEGYSLFK